MKLNRIKIMFTRGLNAAIARALGLKAQRIYAPKWGGQVIAASMCFPGSRYRGYSISKRNGAGECSRRIRQLSEGKCICIQNA